MNGAEILVKCLEDQGVKHVFGIPGNHILGIYSALQNSKIQHILGTHEPGIGFMADGYGRITRKPGVLLLTAGPGALNAVNPIAQAYVESSPVVVIAATCDSTKWGKGLYHELEHPEVQTEIFKEITKWNARVNHPDDIPSIIQKAFEEALNGRTRPVYIEIPENIFRMPGKYKRVNHKNFKPKKAPENQIKKAVDMLLQSYNPLIYIGGGTRSSDAGKEIMRLCNLLKISVVTSYMAKGVVPETFKYSVGCGAGLLGTEAAQQEIKNMDCLIAIGTRFNEIGTGFFSLKVPENLIHIDIDPKEIGRNYKPKVGIVGDAKTVVKQLNEAISKRKKETRGKEGEAVIPALNHIVKEEEYKKILKEVNETTSKINPLTVIHALEEHANKDTMIFADAGNSSVWVLGHPQLSSETIITPAGYNSMGFALPAAIAAKLAHPKKESVAVIGDGCFLMTGMELLTAVRYKIPVKVIVLHDDSYNTLKFFQDLVYQGNHFETNLTTFNFSRFANEVGAKGFEVKEGKRLKGTMVSFLKHKGPALLDVHVDSEILPLISRRIQKLFMMMRGQQK
jgi:acetolactate synthase I/II/III large subunit